MDTAQGTSTAGPVTDLTGSLRLFVTVACKDLPQTDIFSKRVDATCALFTKVPGEDSFHYHSRTDRARWSQNPTFSKGILVEVGPLLHSGPIKTRDTFFRFSVYDMDSSSSLLKDDLIGDVVVSARKLAEASRRGESLTLGLSILHNTNHLPSMFSTHATESSTFFSCRSERHPKKPVIVLTPCLLDVHSTKPVVKVPKALKPQLMVVELQVQCSGLLIPTHATVPDVHTRRVSLAGRKAPIMALLSTHHTSTPSSSRRSSSALRRPSLSVAAKVAPEDAPAAWRCIAFTRDEDSRKYQYMGHTEPVPSHGMEEENPLWSVPIVFQHLNGKSGRSARKRLRLAVFFREKGQAPGCRPHDNYSLVGFCSAWVNDILEAQPSFNASLSMADEAGRNLYQKKKAVVTVYARYRIRPDAPGAAVDLATGKVPLGKRGEGIPIVKRGGTSETVDFSEMMGPIAKRSKGGVRQWKVRWFVLCGGVMQYWENEAEWRDDVRPKATVPVRGAKLQTTSSSQKGGAGFTVELKNGRTYRLSVSDSAGRVRWLQAFHQNGGLLQ